jgi:predicted GNAT superfamily acetyltransferase
MSAAGRSTPVPAPLVGMTPERVRVRELEGHDELKRCVELQEAVWGPTFGEKVPGAILMVAQRLGGVVAGAFDESDALIGFVFGITGIEDGEPVHWSDMLATLPGARNRGIGTRLKIFQREVCLNRGIRIMYWTYDPLQSRNGWVNFAKLGAVSREYARDLYGMSDSPLHRGIGTDRLVIRWALDSRRAALRIRGDDALPAVEAFANVPRAFAVGSDGRPAQESSWLEDEPSRLLVPLPHDIQAVQSTDPETAARWRTSVRAALEAALAGGLEVRELIRGSVGEHPHLLLEAEVPGVGG